MAANTMPQQKSTGMLAVMRYFGIPVATFKKEWGELSDQDKEQLKSGVDNGTLSY